jgi:hypothetical protein
MARITVSGLQTWFTGFAFFLCIGLYCFHFHLIWKYVVDVPYEDEWASFEPNQLPSGVSLGGLIVQHNEHRLVTTRLLVWLQYCLNVWNLAIHQIVNFVFYGLILLAIVWLARRDAPEDVGLGVLCFFLVYLLSPINRANHFMGYQSQVHFWLLFLVLACCLVFSEAEKWVDLAIGTVAAILSTYSMAGGFVSSLVMLTMFGMFKASRINCSTQSSQCKRSYFHQICVFGILSTITLLWLVDYRKPLHHPVLTLPHEWQFWVHFLNLVAFGFGIDRVSTTLGAFFMCVVLAPMVGLILIHGRNLPTGSWRSFTLILAVLGVLASVSAGRAGFGIEQAKESRYFEFAMPLLPLSVVNWTLFLRRRKCFIAATVASLWIICLLAFWDNWREFRYYKREAVDRRIGLKCLEEYYKEKGGSNCPTLFPSPLPTRWLEEAKALNVSFYRSITSQSERDKRASPFLYRRGSN